MYDKIVLSGDQLNRNYFISIFVCLALNHFGQVFKVPKSFPSLLSPMSKLKHLLQPPVKCEVAFEQFVSVTNGNEDGLNGIA